VVSDVPVDDETPVVTSRISRSIGTQSFGDAHRGRVYVRVFIGSRSVGAQSFGDAHRGRVYVCVFIRVSVRACCESLRCIV
jgi:hypothetical protein